MTTTITPTTSKVSANFDVALKAAEYLREKESRKYCVCLKYGVFGAFPYSYAINKDYPIVCITI